MTLTTTTAAINGLVGGLVATTAMTIAMLTLGDDAPPPTAAFWATYVGEGAPDQYLLQGMVLHAAYGVAAGVVFAAGSTLAGLGLVGAPVPGLVGGVVYGVVLFAGAAGFWMNVVLDTDPDRGQVAGFLAFHLVYGVVLGAVAGTGLLT